MNAHHISCFDSCICTGDDAYYIGKAAPRLIIEPRPRGSASFAIQAINESIDNEEVPSFQALVLLKYHAATSLCCFIHSFI